MGLAGPISEPQSLGNREGNLSINLELYCLTNTRFSSLLHSVYLQNLWEELEFLFLFFLKKLSFRAIYNRRSVEDCRKIVRLGVL